MQSNFLIAIGRWAKHFGNAGRLSPTAIGNKATRIQSSNAEIPTASD
jgi:hypothetical protein